MSSEEAKKKLEIVRAYKDACNALAQRVNEQLFGGGRLWYWIADDTGDVCDYEDGDFLSATEMTQIIANGMSYDDYAEWRDANSDKKDKGYINLKSWLRGARHDMLTTKKKYGEWISVDDELPPYDESVLCCNIADPDDMFFCHRSDNPHVQTDSHGWCLYMNGNITHWMRIKQMKNNNQNMN